MGTRRTFAVTRWLIISAALPLSAAAQLRPDAADTTCIQNGGALACKPAIVGAWVYRTIDLYNDTIHPDEAGAYAYLLRIREPESVFALAYRWGTATRAGYETVIRHAIETSSWKLYMRCLPGQSEAQCDRQPEYMGYQRLRSVTCPAGYGFGSDATSPYCVPDGATDRASVATSRMLATVTAQK